MLVNNAWNGMTLLPCSFYIQEKPRTGAILPPCMHSASLVLYLLDDLDRAERAADKPYEKCPRRRRRVSKGENRRSGVVGSTVVEVKKEREGRR